MKHIYHFCLLFCFFVGSPLLTSCGNDEQLTIQTNKEDVKAAITKTIDELYASKLEISEDLVRSQLAKNLNNFAVLEVTRSGSEIGKVSQNAKDIVEELCSVDPQQADTKEEYIESLYQILNNKKNNVTSEEFEGIKNSIFISSYIMDLYLNEKGLTRGWWAKWGKCAAGIAGGALTAGLGGAVAGSALPLLGTTAGAIIGAIGGGLGGAAAAC